PLDLVGARVGREIDVGVGRRHPQEGVAHRAAHQEALVPGRDEPLRELAGRRSRLVEPGEARRHGHPVILPVAHRHGWSGCRAPSSRPACKSSHRAGVPSISRRQTVGDWLWFWIVAALVLAIAELVTPFLFFMISFATGAAAAAVVAGISGGVALQWLSFVIVSFAALGVLVPVGHRIARAEGEDIQEGSTRWVGRTGVVVEDIP